MKLSSRKVALEDKVILVPRHDTFLLMHFLLPAIFTCSHDFVCFTISEKFSEIQLFLSLLEKKVSSLKAGSPPEISSGP